jgi:inorganic pyrophosphatase
MTPRATGNEHNDRSEHLYGSREAGWVEVTVEIPRGSRNKYEYDHQRHLIRLDRVLYSSMHYPTDYGFLSGTIALDGDPLDVLVIVEEPTFPGCAVRARPIGTLDMIDENGVDEKILAVPVDDPRFNDIMSLSDLAEHWSKEISAFFDTYKKLQGKPTEVRGWQGVDEAWRVIEACAERFEQANSMPPSVG